MRMVLASHNPGKLREIREIMEPLGIEVVLQSELGIDIEVEETGTTFEENAELKARAVAKAANMPAIADDSGLMAEALGGRPGIYSARFGGASCPDDASRTRLLIESLKDEEDKRAAYYCAVCCVFPDGRKLEAHGVCPGSIISEFRGKGGFGYDPVFRPEGYLLTMAELTEEEKNNISHRGKALRALARKLEEK